MKLVVILLFLGLTDLVASQTCPVTPQDCYLKRIERKLDAVLKLLRDRSQVVRRNCAEHFKAGNTNSGVYSIDPDGAGAFDVFCDQVTDGGGWTVFQKRIDGSVDFYRGWNDYKIGFGDPAGEYWLGNDKINRLTRQGTNKLRVDLEDTTGQKAHAEYSLFAVSSESTKYQLSLGAYSGTAGDSLTYHRGMAFSTKDRDNDLHGTSCATAYKGGWWYKTCHYANLNGRYLLGHHKSYADGVNWYHWKGYHDSLKRADMKIRPAGF